MLTISLVTPSLNQSRFLDQTLASVLDQGDPALEYVVVDGGSTDESQSIIERHSSRLTAWSSKPDKGQADAINLGFAQTTGEIMGWINSDDRLLPGSLELIRELFVQFPQIQWLTSGFPANIDESGRLVRLGRSLGFAREPFRLGMNRIRSWSRFSFIQQESTFWRRELWESAGGQLNPGYRLAIDFELWTRFFDRAELWTVDTALGAFRLHPDQQTATQLDRYRQEALAILDPASRPTLLAARARCHLPPAARRRLRLGWTAPFVAWSRGAGDWYADRRLI
jgi:glycosyltransferase involved in cell wall biosynthesis